MTDFRRIAQGAAVLALALSWAFNWPMMKIGLTVVEPWTFRAFLLIFGGLGCLGIALVMGISLRIPRSDWPWLLAIAALQGFLWNGLSGFGIAAIEASRASILAFTMPVWATLLSMWVLGERVTLRRLAGLGLGMIGMALLLAPALTAVGQSLDGALLMIGAAMAWGAATVVYKAADWKMHPLAVAGWHFLIGGAPLAVAATVWGRPETLLAVDGPTIAALSFSLFVGMIFCQIVWFAVIRSTPANVAAISTLCVPPMGVFFSNIVLGERIGLYELMAMAVVTAAMTLISTSINWRAIRRQPRASRPG